MCVSVQVELFRELQMLSSDYLRQRALYSLQELVTRYLTEESLQQQRGREDNAAVCRERSLYIHSTQAGF